MMTVSLASELVMNLTIPSVTHPKVPVIRKLMDEFGYEKMLDAVTRVIIWADTCLGGDGDAVRCQTTAATVMLNNSHRSFSFILLSIREGMARTSADDPSRDSKAFNKINTQLVNEWCAVQEGKIIGMAEGEHAKYTVRGDNYDSRHLDRMEHDATSKDRKISGMAREIDALRTKLKNKD